MAELAAALLLGATVFVLCLLARDTARLLSFWRSASACTCRKGALDPWCPRHGAWSR